MFLTACGSIGGRPSLFTDTTAYVRQGEYLATRLHLAGPLAAPEGLEQPPALSRTAIAAYGPTFTTVAAARSPFYGFPLFMLASFGSIWLVALVQASVAGWLLRVVASVVLPDRIDVAFWTAVAVLGVGSSLPFFAAFAAPDVFAGYALIAVALLLAMPHRLRTRDRLGLWATLTAAMLFHRSIDALVLGVTIIGLVGLARRGMSVGTLMARGAVVASGGAVTVLAAVALQSAYHRDTGYLMGTPPFLAARVLIDGPGKAYLDASCPGGVGPTFCRYKDAAMNDEDDVLWRTKGGVFGSASYGDRRSMEREELAFVATSIRFAPGLALVTALRNWVVQLSMLYVDDPLGDPALFLAHAGTDIPATLHLYRDLTPCKVQGGCRLVSILVLKEIVLAVEAPVLIVSVFVLGLAGLASNRRPDGRRAGPDDEHVRLVAFAGRLVLYGIVLNAAVCGILSGPFPRYQARVVWLLPMLAVLSVLVSRRYRGAR